MSSTTPMQHTGTDRRAQARTRARTPTQVACSLGISYPTMCMMSILGASARSPAGLRTSPVTACDKSTPACQLLYKQPRTHSRNNKHKKTKNPTKLYTKRPRCILPCANFRKGFDSECKKSAADMTHHAVLAVPSSD